MEQMKIDPNMIVEVKYSGAAQYLKPVVFAEGDSYCCLWGPDLMEGVVGCGDTPQEALDDWENDLKERINKQDPEDAVANEATEVLFEKKQALVKQRVKEFFDEAIRPPRKK